MAELDRTRCALRPHLEQVPGYCDVTYFNSGIDVRDVKTFARTRRPSTRPVLGNFSQLNTPAAHKLYKCQQVTLSYYVIPIANFCRRKLAQFRYSESSWITDAVQHEGLLE